MFKGTLELHLLLSVSQSAEIFFFVLALVAACLVVHLFLLIECGHIPILEHLTSNDVIEIAAL